MTPSEHVSRPDNAAAVTDPLTTLYTKEVFHAVLDKEIQRCDRFGHPLALILLDVDHLGEINSTQGAGVGDRLLERIGIGVRQYFRETDWVARTSDDTVAVLLPETPRATAERLADGVRAMIEHRLQLQDHRSGQQVAVTVSVGLLVADLVSSTVGAEELMAEASAAVDRAKQRGRNCVEQVDAKMSARSARLHSNAPMN